jgi:hypothetical protein
MQDAPRPDWRAQRDAYRARILAALAPRFAADLRARRRRGAAPLETMYARTLAGVGPADRDELLARFCASTWFGRYGELPDRTDQLSLEEAFYRFACDAAVGDADVRRVEFADAIVRALAVQPQPAFGIPPEVQRTRGGYVTVVAGAGASYLFAATGAAVVRGPVSPIVAAAVRSRGQRPAGSPFAAGAWRAAVAQLAHLGVAFAHR